MPLLSILIACQFEPAPITDGYIPAAADQERTALGDRTLFGGDLYGEGFGKTVALADGRLWTARRGHGALCDVELRQHLPDAPDRFVDCTRADSSFGEAVAIAGRTVASGDHILFDGQLDGAISDLVPSPVHRLAALDEDTLAVAAEDGLHVLRHNRTWTEVLHSPDADSSGLLASRGLIVVGSAPSQQGFVAKNGEWLATELPGAVLAVNDLEVLVDPGFGTELFTFGLDHAGWAPTGTLHDARGPYTTWLLDDVAVFGVEPGGVDSRGAIDRFPRDSGVLDASLRLSTGSVQVAADLEDGLLAVGESGPNLPGRVHLFDWSEDREALGAGDVERFGICSPDPILVGGAQITLDHDLLHRPYIELLNPNTGNGAVFEQVGMWHDAVWAPAGTWNVRVHGYGVETDGLWDLGEHTVEPGVPLNLRLPGAWRTGTVSGADYPIDGVVYLHAEDGRIFSAPVEEGVFDIFAPDGTYYAEVSDHESNWDHWVSWSGPHTLADEPLNLLTSHLPSTLDISLNGEPLESAELVIRRTGTDITSTWHTDWPNTLAPGVYDAWLAPTSASRAMIGEPYVEAGLVVGLDGTGAVDFEAPLVDVNVLCNGEPEWGTLRWTLEDDAPPEYIFGITGAASYNPMHVVPGRGRLTYHSPNGNCGDRMVSFDTTLMPVDGRITLDLEAVVVDTEIWIDGELRDDVEVSVRRVDGHDNFRGTRLTGEYEITVDDYELFLQRRVLITEAGTIRLEFETETIDPRTLGTESTRGEFRIDRVYPGGATSRTGSERVQWHTDSFQLERGIDHRLVWREQSNNASMLYDHVWAEVCFEP